jgi:hypothetical protein
VLMLLLLSPACRVLHVHDASSQQQEDSGHVIICTVDPDLLVPVLSCLHLWYMR